MTPLLGNLGSLRIFIMNYSKNFFSLMSFPIGLYRNHAFVLSDSSTLKGLRNNWHLTDSLDVNVFGINKQNSFSQFSENTRTLNLWTEAWKMKRKVTKPFQFNTWISRLRFVCEFAFIKYGPISYFRAFFNMSCQE